MVLIIKRAEDDPVNKQPGRKFADVLTDLAKAQGKSLTEYLEAHPEDYALACKLDTPVTVGAKVIR